MVIYDDDQDLLDALYLRSGDPIGVEAKLRVISSVPDMNITQMSVLKTREEKIECLKDLENKYCILAGAYYPAVTLYSI
ncbi:MAG: hypothetical protein ABIH25_01430 [Candidatus Woesearchaeota archaeon]